MSEIQQYLAIAGLDPRDDGVQGGRCRDLHRVGEDYRAWCDGFETDVLREEGRQGYTNSYYERKDRKGHMLP